MNNNAQIDDTRFLELLQKWQSGDFTRADEQELNALASADAFRQEALNGLLEYPEHDHAKTLALLSNRINKRQKPRIALPRMMAMAAALALLIAAVWFMNRQPLVQADGEIATKLPAPPSASPMLDSTPSPTISETTFETADDIPAARKKPLSDMAAAKDLEQETKMEEVAALNTPDNYSSAPLGNVVAAEPKPRAQYEGPGVPAERSTNVATPPEEAQAYAKKSSAKAKAKQPVPSYEDAKAKAKETVAADKMDAATAQPIGGWEDFRAYLNEKARLTPEALANNVSGIVRLQFSLDKKNQPVDIQVLKALGHGCDSTAIQLIKNYSWQSGNGQLILVDIPFVR